MLKVIFNRYLTAGFCSFGLLLVIIAAANQAGAVNSDLLFNLSSGDSLQIKDSSVYSNTERLISGVRIPARRLVPLQINNTQATAGAATLDKISVAGFIRFIAIYRNMQKSYSDQESSDRNISFSDYPVLVSNSAFNPAYPLIDLNIKAKPTSNTSFSVGYAYTHLMTGQREDTSKRVITRSNLNFEGNIYTKVGNFRMQAGGGVIWTTLSPFTIGNVEYRDTYFERLPWDWYTNSFQRYQDYYRTSMIVGSERYGNAPMQGFVLNGDRLPLGFSFMAIYGRSQASVSLDRARTHFPSILYAGRIQKQLGAAKVGVNYYNQWGFTDRVNYIKDQLEIVTGDLRVKAGPVALYSEFGAGRVFNPLSPEGNWGHAVNLSADIDKSLLRMPLTLRFYSVDKSVVSINSGTINSNPTVVAGGFGNDPLYASVATFVNVAQEVGLMSNNRTGMALKTEKNIGNLIISVGTGMSQEIENFSDTITIQHRVNAFSRSRFLPWYQAGGPYGRIKSVWLRTFETITITDTVSNYKKGFNGLDLLLKYKTSFLGKNLILLNFNNYNSIQEGFSVIPQFSDKAFVRTFYEEFTAMYQLTPKYSLIGYYGYERVLANNRTVLSPENGKPIDQTGQAIGLGLDYDFAPNAGIYLRHRWMFHKDKNFVLDEFKGQETTIEFKLFF
ncbi:MAG: hypothetical protein ACK40G_09365 [Cytophagaceae bacterium]